MSISGGVVGMKIFFEAFPEGKLEYSLLDSARGFRKVALADSAKKLGLLDFIGEGQVLVSAVADNYHLDLGATIRYLNVLTYIGLLRKLNEGDIKRAKRDILTSKSP